MKRILLALAAILATGGIVLSGSIPAQAVSMSTVNHCNWPGRASFDLVSDSSAYGYNWRAYSPTGYFLGSHWGQFWATPWEDVTVFVSSNDTYYNILKWCR